MKTPISYYGGKQLMVTEILPLFPPHVQYVEPFIGGGAVFFAKGKSENEVINDLNGDVTNFYWQVKNNFDDLQRMIHGTLHSEIHFKEAARILKLPVEETHKLDRAWAFWVQTNMSFSSRMFGGFAFGETGCGDKTANKRDGFLPKYLKRLREVEIFNRDALDVIKLKDSPRTLFYCDPPYVSSDCGHYDGYTMDDFRELLELLSGIEGKFLLSSYPEEVLMEFRSRFGWNTRDITKKVLVTGKRSGDKMKTECLTWNYDLRQDLFTVNNY